MVFSGLSTAWRLASWPTRRSPVLASPATDGVKRLPSLLMITVGFPPSITATTEFVVPRSMPTAFAIPHLTPCILRLAHSVTWHTSRSSRGLRSAHSPFLIYLAKIVPLMPSQRGRLSTCWSALYMGLRVDQVRLSLPHPVPTLVSGKLWR